MTRYLLAGLAGFMAGALWLLALGIPLVLPSWLDLHERAQTNKTIAEGQADAFDESEAIRKAEQDDAVGGVEDERQDCDGRIADLTRVYERELAAALYGDRHDETDDADPAGGRNIRPPGGGVRDDPALGED